MNASLPPQPTVPRSEQEDEPTIQPELDRGHPGASAAREHRRRRANREARTRRRHPLLGGLLLAISNSPQHERAWQTGRRGEERVGLSLERRTANGPAIVLHDRRMPGGYGNVDHLAIAPRGVFVIDAKAVKGKVRIAQPLFGKPKLMVAGRNRTKLVDGLDRQVDAVRRALVEGGCGDVPVHGVLCFTKADLPLLGICQIRGHRLHYCRATARKLNRSGPYEKDAIDRIARQLAVAFPAA
ncbi:MAG TPA: nuclease-related domain-containing protein [Solirubrobacteraceae bacterium]|jgi:hypothetical protein|nr:nuclease-related domain-containing protein [Solirubrobacteraceae bacterium]